MKRMSYLFVIPFVMPCTTLISGCSNTDQIAQNQLYDQQRQINALSQEVSRLSYQLSTIQRGGGDIQNLTNIVNRIKEKTDNICFENQMGVTVMRPCHLE